MTLTPSFREDVDPLSLPAKEAARLLAPLPCRRFVVIGDSLARGTGDATDGYAPGGWAARVAQALERSRPLDYRNLARVGATTADVAAEQLDAAVAAAPDLVHLSAGANDLFAAEPDFAATETRLREMHSALRSTGATVTTFTLGRAFQVRRFTDWDDRVAELNRIVRRLAADHDTLLVDMWDHPVNHRSNLLSRDGIHFAAVGQAAMAAAVVRAVACHAARSW